MNEENALYNAEEDAEEEDYYYSDDYFLQKEEGEDFEEDMDYYESYDKDNLEECYQSELIETYMKLFSELEHCVEDDQILIIEEMNELMDEMDEDEFIFIFEKEFFNKIGEMIEEKEMLLVKALVLLKNMGYCKVLRGVWSNSFADSSLSKRFEKMIIEEDKKKEEKNEKLLADLCICLLILPEFNGFMEELPAIFVRCLMKVALKKEESEEAQKEAEIALIALSRLRLYIIEKKLYLKEITEIIKHHQEHHNLSRIGYQSAWKFLINRLFCDEDLERLIVNERHFAREAAKELEELSKCVDWKKKKEEMSREEMKEANISKRWIRTLGFFIESCTLWNDEFIELIRSIIQVLRAAKENHGEISGLCIYSLRNAAENRAVKVEYLLKSGAVDAVLEEVQLPTIREECSTEFLYFFKYVCEKLKEKTENKMEEAKRKELKRKVFEKMEDEGYEDCIFGSQRFFVYMLIEDDSIFTVEDFFVHP
ncbi:uncharacterized protein MONOS_8849 [Monocercomonoides exilis]|uniref:uncharacterized protein n=1 Tax=Monocercomonoides exilis TaxID=2049356 RepID=UPI00355A0620|nr:hypothetical protein MONOS_8849 [Monocercomonoides exilis]|eukprot:MONOS_8849.1-p1 / transcript=MONOS_8849.1 / gene=MONOS_8849 / organism=Monocercomonoides_exilis_PA203 / gene_product=unspecified product / transcript_product=unspecified product / location=Mono_scaffold00345:54192-55759(+) / protein_length=482 / sequence_SO=supercontig / SO=protein_coding / is_pseudo=false